MHVSCVFFIPKPNNLYFIWAVLVVQPFSGPNSTQQPHAAVNLRSLLDMSSIRKQTPDSEGAGHRRATAVWESAGHLLARRTLTVRLVRAPRALALTQL